MIAKELRASVRSVERWRRAWREGGMEALRSAGPANSPTVTDDQFTVLEEELGKGPSAHGAEALRVLEGAAPTTGCGSGTPTAPGRRSSSHPATPVTHPRSRRAQHDQGVPRPVGSETDVVLADKAYSSHTIRSHLQRHVHGDGGEQHAPTPIRSRPASAHRPVCGPVHTSTLRPPHPLRRWVRSTAGEDGGYGRNRLSGACGEVSRTNSPDLRDVEQQAVQGTAADNGPVQGIYFGPARLRTAPFPSDGLPSPMACRALRRYGPRPVRRTAARRTAGRHLPLHTILFLKRRRDAGCRNWALTTAGLDTRSPPVNAFRRSVGVGQAAARLIWSLKITQRWPWSLASHGLVDTFGVLQAFAKQ
ncbi:hypothetical protein [Streptomyces sp. Isolate_45]|uniref:helix-turn-helix domain-containing protein n=1 Tax=Streptomyces sp. Isolate_45 TaxID=2950111 RepID=UPI002481A31A|nr:hypothetical protein [Streptomyces sp. Isolate_45]MDA5284122.1 hypothetical protein [Streptomyces sp. Isolate_45]